MSWITGQGDAWIWLQELDAAGWSGQPWGGDASCRTWWEALLCSKPLSQSSLEFCRGLTPARHTSW